MKKTYVVWDQNPFVGYIRFVGIVDINQPPDGSTLFERLQELLIKYPTTQLHFFELLAETPDRELVKFDSATDTLVPLEPGDITPAALKQAEMAQKDIDISTNLPTWSHVQTAISNISNLDDAKVFLEKLSRVVYWLAKNSLN